MTVRAHLAAWRHPDRREVLSFAMLTVNADGHPLMRRLHRPEDEKRMVVILDPEDYGNWLSCRVQDAHRYFRAWDKPRAGRALAAAAARTKAGSVRTLRPPPPETGQLF